MGIGRAFIYKYRGIDRNMRLFVHIHIILINFQLLYCLKRTVRAKTVL